MSSNNRLFRLFGFTVAEVLITLTIIGVVASLTIPALLHKYQKQVWAAKAAKAYSFLNNSVKLSLSKYECTNIDCAWPTGSYPNAGSNLTLDKFMEDSFPKADKVSAYTYPIKLLDGTETNLSQGSLISGDAVYMSYRITDDYVLSCHDLSLKTYGNVPYYKCTEKEICGSCIIFTDIQSKKYIFGRNVFRVNFLTDGGWVPNTIFNTANSKYCDPTQPNKYYESCLSKMQQNGWKMDY